MSGDDVLDVLLVGEAGSVQVKAVNDRLAATGARALRWNLDDLRTSMHTAQLGALAIWTGERWAQVTYQTTVWWHRAGHVDAAGLDDDEARLAIDECPRLLIGALLGAGVRWVDEPYVTERAENRLVQLAAARAVGAAIPDTRQTNYAAGADDLRHNGDVVAKSVSSGYGIAPYVGLLEESDLDALEGLPTFLQQRADADADLRVVTVAGRSWVWRREREPTTLDWRQVDPDGRGFALVEDKVVENHSTAIVARLGLTTGVSDWLRHGSSASYLETNPQGQWSFLPGSDTTVLGAFCDHLRVPSLDGGAGQEGPLWPTVWRRVLWDLGRKSKAEPADGLKPPPADRPAWIDQVSILPGAVEVAQAANQEAKDAAKTAEDKSGRLVQLGLALLALAFAVGAYQLAFVLARTPAWIPTLLPVGAALLCLSVASFKGVEIDRVGFYGGARPAMLAGAPAAAVPALRLEAEERSRQLARWSADNKHTDLMQARAWLARGLVALILAAGVAATCRAASADSTTKPTTTTLTTRRAQVPLLPSAAPTPARGTSLP